MSNTLTPEKVAEEYEVDLETARHMIAIETGVLKSDVIEGRNPETARAAAAKSTETREAPPA